MLSGVGRTVRASRQSRSIPTPARGHGCGTLTFAGRVIEAEPLSRLPRPVSAVKLFPQIYFFYVTSNLPFHRTIRNDGGYRQNYLDNRVQA
jgi:hypothetical protein